MSQMRLAIGIDLAQSGLLAPVVGLTYLNAARILIFLV
jgi:hypothetical protein